MASDTASIPSLPYSRRDLVKWWEARRLRYNLMVGAVGIVTWFLVLCVGSLAVKPGVDFEEPIMMIIGPIIYGLFANLCYSLGWIVDTWLYRGRPRTRLYSAGLIFSLVMTASPGIWAVIAWCITLYTGKKLD
jgi:MFS family permease